MINGQICQKMYLGVMQEEYLRHNLFIKGMEDFESSDPHLGPLRELAFVHPLDWWRAVDWHVPGIYMLTGGRQIGKTTSVKLLIRHLLRGHRYSAHQVFYLPCDQVDDDQHLARILRLFLDGLRKPGERFLIAIDEVTFVRNWDRAIKALADEGVFRQGVCLVTGSDSIVLKEAASRFPGRRGTADVTDFHLYPLTFPDYVLLTDPPLAKEPERRVEKLFEAFERYNRCGGYLRAINDLHATGDIKPATFMTFEQWIRGDVERRGKDAEVLKGVLKTMYETSGSQVTYSSLTNRLGQIVTETFINYVALLMRLDILFELQAFDQNTRLGFPRKARKIHFFDPFILDTIERWLARERILAPRDTASLKAESIVASHYFRCQPTYYLKAAGEIDVVVVTGRAFVTLEVKWSEQLRNQDLKQLAKYKHSAVLTRNFSEGSINSLPTIPLPLFLMRHSSAIAVDEKF